jgi:dienelactone hydrolase
MNKKLFFKVNIILWTSLLGMLIPVWSTAQTRKIIDSIICKSDQSQSYAAYAPEIASRMALPVIYFFDPHGNGALPLSKYKILADRYGFILIGSNNSKNGNDWSTTEYIWKHLFEDTKQRFKINGDQLYTCGFSGGAKVASYLALKYRIVKGVIANGAGLPDGSPAGNFDFSFTAVAGDGDMNLTELLALNKDLDKTKTRHRLIVFDGKHEWIPQNGMNQAFAGLRIDAMEQSLIPKDGSFLNKYIGNSKKRIDSLYKLNQLVKAGQECLFTIRVLEGVAKDQIAWFQDKLSVLEHNKMYQHELETQASLLQREEQTKTEYMQHLQQNDMGYWVNTIKDLQIKTNKKTAETGMYLRLLAYLSLAFYSISNHLINSNVNDAAAHYVELYKLADPSNSEAWYFSAILHARSGRNQAAENDLLKSVDAGFRDRVRMRQQAEFKNQSPAINFSLIENKMRKTN